MNPIGGGGWCSWASTWVRNPWSQHNAIDDDPQHSLTSSSRSRPVQLNTHDMGHEAIVLKEGRRLCGSGGIRATAPIVQDKAYFEVKVQQSGKWAVGLASPRVDLRVLLPVAAAATSDPESAAAKTTAEYCVLREGADVHHSSHLAAPLATLADPPIEEGDVLGFAYDHIELRIFVNGERRHCTSSATLPPLRGTVYPFLFVDAGAVLEVLFDAFAYQPPSGFRQILIEQSIL